MAVNHEKYRLRGEMVFLEIIVLHMRWDQRCGRWGARFDVVPQKSSPGQERILGIDLHCLNLFRVILDGQGSLAGSAYLVAALQMVFYSRV